MSFFTELRRRNVIRMAGLYLVGAWLLIQVAETVLPAFDVPGWVLRAIILLLALGLVPALVFSWLYELTPEGLKRDHDVDPDRSITVQTAHRLDRLTLVALALVVLLIVVDRWLPNADVARRDAAAAPTTQPTVVIAAAEVAAAPGERSVAVLPFVNMSNDPEQEYFSDGISEELLNRLAKIPDLQVAARTSAFQFKGRNLDVADIGRQLRVAHVLEGSVRKAGARLRITAQLIDSRSGYHLWSETYDRDAADVFRVQDEIAGEIARALKARLGIAAVASPAGRADPQAYDDYLLGRSFVARRFVENLESATEAFDRAIARDPQFAEAHSGRAFAQLLLPQWGSGDGEGHLREALASAGRALAIDPDHAEALMVRGMAAWTGLQAQAARADLERAYALSPNSVDILNIYGDFLHLSGAPGEAERVKRAAMLRDPLAMVHPLNLADIMAAQGRFAESLELAERAHALGGGAYALDRIVIAHILLSQPAQAAASTEQACALETIERSCSVNRALVLGAQGRTDEALAQLRKLAGQTVLQDGALSDTILELLPWSFVQLGDIAEATRYQRRCLENGCLFVTAALMGHRLGIALPEEVSTDPDWLAVWADPRLADVMIEFRRNVAAWRGEQR
jgi:adenylate cyclase